MTAEQNDKDVPLFLVESDKPFSQSFLWQLQRQFYTNQGVEAWSKGLIPFGVTTNPYIAMMYSRVIVGFMQDSLATLDTNEPIYILELGAGAGRLGFHILRQLDGLIAKHPTLSAVRYQYILTDLVEKNVTFWQNHPAFAPFIANNQVDFASFDVVEDKQITLRHSGKVLQTGTLKNPLIVIANYVMDSLPMDLFNVEDKQLYHVTVSLYSDQDKPDLTNPEIINTLELEYDRIPTTTDFYHNEEYARILETYCNQGFDGIVSFPYLALECIRGLCDFSNQRLMMLSADKGSFRFEELFESEVPAIALHDNGFSMQFNYHAIIALLEGRGGKVLTSNFRADSIEAIAFFLGQPPLEATTTAFDNNLDAFSPGMVYMTLRTLARKTNLPPTIIINMLRVLQFDPDVFDDLYPVLIKNCKDLTTRDVRNVVLTMIAIWKNYYHIGEASNIPYKIGTVLQSINQFKTALILYEQSIPLFGDNAQVRFMMAICHANLGEKSLALKLLDSVMAETPDFEDARAMREKIANDLHD